MRRWTVELRGELIQLAAVAVAWVEEITNGGARSRLILGRDGFPLGTRAARHLT